MGDQVTLRATQDAHVFEDQPARNFGERPVLGLKNDSPAKRAFIGFSLKALPSESNVQSALLRLRLKDAWAGTHDITAQRIDEKWSERTVTWTNQPTVAGATAAETVVDGADGDLIEIDVTTLVAAAVERGKAWHGLRVIVDGSGTFKIHASEAANRQLRPELRVVYSVPPEPPTRLRPRGGDAVDASKPKLAWDVDDQAELRVQVHTADDFTTPDYDSDWVVSDENGWDLALAASPAFSDVTDGDERWWRVNVKDSDGNESGWSNAQRWERHTYGVLSIDSPAVDGDAVESSTPTIVTSLTGRTQTRIGWMVIMSEPSGPDVRVVGRVTEKVKFEGGRATSDPSFELGPDAIRKVLWNYLVAVRVWDEYDRGTAVGERSFLEVQRRFVYAPTAATTPVSALVASQDGDSPKVTLTWTRATAPDSFDIWVDDELAVQGIDPADALVSGTSYAYDVWEGAPGQEHEYVVVATEDGVDSTGNPVATLTPSVRGLWLVCPSQELEVWLHTGGPVDLSLGESGGTFELLNRQSVVRITDSVRGLEGTVSGRLKTTTHGTAREERAALLAMKELDPRHEIRVIFPGANFPAILGPFDLPLHALPLEEYEVGIPIWQSDEFEVLQ